MTKHWDWLLLILLGLAASWQYLLGTPVILGLDYFNHLNRAHTVKMGIEEGTLLPAYNSLVGGGTIFIRYQGMLIAQFMGWLCYLLQKIFALSDTQVIMYVGRISCILLNLFSGIAFHYSAKKIIPAASVCLIGSTAYMFGWCRLGVVLHVGALQRAGALVFLPVALALFITFLRRPLARKEKIVFAVALACCLMAHPAIFSYFVLIAIIYLVVSLPGNILNLATKCRELLMPMVIAMGISAWLWLPLLAEKQHYGLQRDLRQQSTYSWTQVLPIGLMQEFVDRVPWFGNRISDPQQGGSYLGHGGGVNSAYMGIVVVFLALVAFTMTGADYTIKVTCYRLGITCLCMLVIIFWQGFRYNIFSFVGYHLITPTRWLSSLYCMACFLSLFGAWRIYTSLKRYHRQMAHWAMGLLILLIVIDFVSLTLQKQVYRYYRPQIGHKDPLGIDKNHGAFDSYDILKRYPRAGRVLDLPTVLLHCNRIYHGRQSAVVDEPYTDWLEATSYSNMVLLRQVRQALNSRFVFGQRNDNYCLKYQHFEVDSNAVHISQRLRLRTRRGWQGTTNITIKFPAPIGHYGGYMILPTELPPQSEIKIRLQGKLLPITAAAKNRKRVYCLVIPFMHDSMEKKHVVVDLEVTKSNMQNAIVIGKGQKPVIAYATPSLAYRLAILDVRFIVVNLYYYRLQIPQLPSFPFIRNIYRSKSSTIYENELSTPFFFPKYVYLLDHSQPWKFFNNRISQHPNYNPEIVGFCYEGKEQDFAGVLTATMDWQRQVVPQFLQKVGQTKNTALIVSQSLERVSYKIDMRNKGFFFPSLHFHPNFRAIIDGSLPVDIYLAQAGMMALNLPQGQYTLTIYYHHPWYDRLGKYLSAGIIIYLLLCAVVPFYSRWRKFS